MHLAEALALGLPGAAPAPADRATVAAPRPELRHADGRLGTATTTAATAVALGAALTTTARSRSGRGRA